MGILSPIISHIMWHNYGRGETLIPPKKDLWGSGRTKGRELVECAQLYASTSH
jgi:hypothetical protein